MNEKRQSVLSRDACKIRGEGSEEIVSLIVSTKGVGGQVLVLL